MPYSAKILKDSISPAGARLTTFEISLPKFVLAELNTHRMLSRNAASSRAIPTAKMIELIETDPVLPIYWGQNKAGMQADTELPESDKLLAISAWLHARDEAIKMAKEFVKLKVHKEITNRLLEPFMFARVIVSGTDWANFFALRCSKDAQPEFKYVADMMKELYTNNTPIRLEYNQWHLPLIEEEDITECIKKYGNDWLQKAKMASVGRICRVSYLNHDGTRNIEKDIELAQKLTENGHWSPFESVAQADRQFLGYSGNFRGWFQFRKSFHNENVDSIGDLCASFAIE